MDPRLYEAARAGNLIKLKELLAKEPAIACLPSRPTRNTILHMAAKVDNLSMLELIWHHYPQLIEKKNSRGNTPLHIAIQAGNLSIVTYLIDHVQHFISSVSAGDGEEENNKYVLLRVPNKDGDIPLHEAVRGRNPRVIEALLRADPKSAFIANKNRESP
ncbi:Ankyrin repeat [Dillenia turbinata]|uniref:Ankyrin repeat n=1 Tax=Dillenia turbinata TaxID=194707 RepID=A0AAN8YXR6_9MAGN